MTIFGGGPPNLRGMKYFDLYCFATIIHSPNPTFVPSLTEIGDLTCITSRLCRRLCYCSAFRDKRCQYLGQLPGVFFKTCQI